MWVQAIFISFAIGWFVADPLVILTRNSLSYTKTIIRSKKYQVLEKWVTTPFRVALAKTVDAVLRLLG